MLLGNIASFGQASAQPKYYNRYKIVEPYFRTISTSPATHIESRRADQSIQHLPRKYKNAYNFDPAKWIQANAPQVDDSNGTHRSTRRNYSEDRRPIQRDGAMRNCRSSSGCMNGHLFNPAPRIGFAFDPRVTEKPPFAADMEYSTSIPTGTKPRLKHWKARHRWCILPLSSTFPDMATSVAPRGCYFR